MSAPTRARPMRFEEKGVFSEGILGEVIAASIFLSCDKGLPNGDDKALVSRIDVGLLKASAPAERHFTVKSRNFGENREGMIVLLQL